MEKSRAPGCLANVCVSPFTAVSIWIAHLQDCPKFLLQLNMIVTNAEQQPLNLKEAEPVDLLFASIQMRNYTYIKICFTLHKYFFPFGLSCSHPLLISLHIKQPHLDSLTKPPTVRCALAPASRVFDRNRTPLLQQGGWQVKCLLFVPHFRVCRAEVGACNVQPSPRVCCQPASGSKLCVHAC